MTFCPLVDWSTVKYLRCRLEPLRKMEELGLLYMRTLTDRGHLTSDIFVLIAFSHLFEVKYGRMLVGITSPFKSEVVGSSPTAAIKAA